MKSKVVVCDQVFVGYYELELALSHVIYNLYVDVCTACEINYVTDCHGLESVLQTLFT